MLVSIMIWFLQGRFYYSDASSWAMSHTELRGKFRALLPQMGLLSEAASLGLSPALGVDAQMDVLAPAVAGLWLP